MKLTDLDEQTILDLKEALSRRFSSDEDRAVLFEAAGLNVTILKGTDLSKFWGIMLKNIEDNEVATHRLLQAAVDLRPTDYNLRTIYRLFVGPRKKQIPVMLIISVPFIFISFYFLFDFLGGANLQKTSPSKQPIIEPSTENLDQQDGEKENMDSKTPELSPIEQEEKTTATEEIKQKPPAMKEEEAKEPVADEEKIPASEKNLAKASQASQTTPAQTTEKPEHTTTEKQTPAIPPKPEKATQNPASVPPAKSTDNKVLPSKTQPPKTQPPKTQPPKTQPTTQSLPSTKQNPNSSEPKPYARCFPSTTNQLIGYWFAGEDHPGKTGRKIVVGRWTHVRNSYPNAANGFKRGESVCVLRPWNRIRISKAPLFVKGKYYWLPLYTHDIIR